MMASVYKRTLPLFLAGILGVTLGFSIMSATAGAANKKHLITDEGPVMQSAKVYAIYWQPPTLQNGAEGTMTPRQNKLVSQLLSDMQPGGMFKVLSQYSGYAHGRKQFVNPSQIRFGGTAFDDTAYPSSQKPCRKHSNCITEKQMRDEITKVMSENGWKPGMDSLYLVYTDIDENVCDSSGCSNSQDGGWCGSHYNAPQNGTQLLYGVVITPSDETCSNAESQSPDAPYLDATNGNMSTDGTLSTTTHEIAETVTDPLGTGWGDVKGNEVADVCSYSFAPFVHKTANLAVGDHLYQLSNLWDNKTNSCVSLGP